MLVLSLFWVLLGLLIGALAIAAKLRPAAWVRGGRLAMLGIGMLAALLGGWSGTWVLGTLFATGTALCLAVLSVALLPRLITWSTHGLHTHQANKPLKNP